jgi:hypothetical protein
VRDLDDHQKGRRPFFERVASDHDEGRRFFSGCISATTTGVRELFFQRLRTDHRQAKNGA